MKVLLAPLLALSVCNGWAASIIISRDPGVSVDFGDSLEVEFSARSFTRYSDGALPSQISFQMAALPFDIAGRVFEASLLTSDGNLLVDFPESLGFTGGFMKSEGYSGPVSVLSGSISLTWAQSLQLFGPGGKKKAVLVLRDSGGQIDLGLKGHNVGQMFSVSVGNGGLSVGASVHGVSLDRVPELDLPELDPAPHLNSPGVPEPGAAGLTLLGLGAGCAWWLGGWRRSRRRR